MCRPKDPDALVKISFHARSDVVEALRRYAWQTGSDVSAVVREAVGRLLSINVSNTHPRGRPRRQLD